MLVFEASIKKRWTRKDESFMSVWRFLGSFSVETKNLNNFNLTWREDASKLLYIKSKVSVDTYGLQNENQAFDIVG